jgi:hypothetical protein
MLLNRQPAVAASLEPDLNPTLIRQQLARTIDQIDERSLSTSSRWRRDSRGSPHVVVRRPRSPRSHVRRPAPSQRSETACGGTEAR